MADWWPLTHLACRSPDPSRVMARLDAGGTLSHADFVRRVGRWQASLAAVPASACAVYLSDPFEFASAVVAAWHAGKTVVLPGDDRPATVQALRDAGFALVGELPGGLQAGDEVLANRVALDLDEARLVVYTSGSQGQPESIGKRLVQLTSELDALEAAFGPVLDAPGPVPTVWATVSHQHIYGLLFLVLWPLVSGRPLSSRRLLYPEDMAACLGPDPTVLVATPAHLKRLGDQLDWQAARQGLRAVFSSGGPLPYEASRSVAEALGKVPIEVFGSSETGGIAWRQCARSEDEAWRPFASVQWRLEEGLLSVSSPCLPDAAWWLTSDRAQPVGEAGFRLLGRADRVVKIEEKRVSLSAIEQHLVSTPWVREAKALVVDTAIGPRVGVVAVPTALGREQAELGRRVLGGLLRQSLSQAVEAMALPRRWRFVDALPVNAQGKTPQSLLLALFAEPTRPEMPAVQWHERGATEALLTLDVHAGLTVFDGHFEVAPILPGVAQLHWALSLGRECFAMPEHFVRLEALKFVQPVRPGTALKLALQFKPRLADPDLCSLAFRLYSQDGAGDAEQREHASGRAVWSYQTEEATHA